MACFSSTQTDREVQSSWQVSKNANSLGYSIQMNKYPSSFDEDAIVAQW